MTTCAEHEATLQIALERVKRLEEALRRIADETAQASIHTIAMTALRPEGT